MKTGNEVRSSTHLDQLLGRARVQAELITHLAQKLEGIADRLVGQLPEQATAAAPCSQTIGGSVGDVQVQYDYTEDAISRAHRAADRLLEV